MHRLCTYLPERQIENLRDLSHSTQISISEWLRLMIDHCLQENMLNQLRPTFSGQLSLGK